MPDEKLGAQLRAELVHAGLLGEPPAPESAPVVPVAEAEAEQPRMSILALLEQDVWWQPKDRPPVRIAAMDKPWRWNAARFLERRAEELHNAELLSTLNSSLFEIPDDVVGEVLDENPIRWLSRKPLYRALTRTLPDPRGTRGQRLAARAVHWSTCPMRLAHPGKLDRCVCIREGGRIVGATNDPATVTP